jgi:hypothetical protein
MVRHGLHPCPALSAGILTAGCEHEHLCEVGMCESCLNIVRQTFIACTRCSESTEPHLCKVAELSWEQW